MDRRTIAMLLAFIGTLCFLAMAFKVIPTNYALFAGTAFFMASGLTWSLMRNRE
jgi:multidrug transporter EmrE-like cation transporter